MITGENELIISVETCLRNRKPFAIYRIPGENRAHFLMQDKENISLIYDLKDLNGRKGFVIAPFSVSKSVPIILIPGEGAILSFITDERVDNRERINERELFIHSSGNLKDKSLCSKDYADCFYRFTEALKCRSFDKLVLSRTMNLQKPKGFSCLSAFRIACLRYIYSYVYLCYTPQTGTWLGSTPEIILSGEKDCWSTVALAGTQPLQDGNLPQTWDDKNRKEQEYVASYIRERLSSLGIQVEENGPYPIYAGALSHLNTDFRFSLSNCEMLGDLLELLHPTPAVCGLPKEEAYRFILEHEGYDRSYYSGFIGWLDPTGRTDLYVNLRCMRIEDDVLTLYAGGGLLTSSRLEDEWAETERKLRTMMSLVIRQ